MKSNNFDQVKKVLWIILVINFIVAILKIVVGSLIESTSMTADGFHSFSDGASNIVGLIGISIASKPKDKEHPYGHRKFEVIASMFIGVMLLVMGFEVIGTSISKFINPTQPSVTISSLVILVITLIMNIIVCTYENKKGKELNSHILVSDSMHTKSDILISIGVLITLIGIKMGLPPIIDPIASLVVSGFILHSSYEIFKSSISILVDKAKIDEEEILNIVYEFEEIKGIHNIRSRGCNNEIHIDMHILVNPNISVKDAHDLSHDIEEKIRMRTSKNTQVIVHVEPFYEEVNK